MNLFPKGGGELANACKRCFVGVIHWAGCLGACQEVRATRGRLVLCHRGITSFEAESHQFVSRELTVCHEVF